MCIALLEAYELDAVGGHLFFKGSQRIRLAGGSFT
jgi:hypothetical protein